MKIVDAKLHGIIDYLVVVFLMLAPTLFGLSPVISMLTYGLGTVHLILTAFTDFQYGFIKLVPLKFHGIIELIVSIVLMFSPLALEDIAKSKVDEFFFSGFGVAVLLTWFITDYNPGK